MTRVFASRLGSKAGQMILDGEFGYMVGYKKREMVKVPLEEVAGKLKMVDPQRLHRQGGQAAGHLLRRLSPGAVPRASRPEICQPPAFLDDLRS